MASTASASLAEPYKTRHTNGHGEPWVFEYDPAREKGIITGLDVDWRVYPVLRGFSHLILSEDETLWLWRSWRQTVDTHGDPGVYGIAQAGRDRKQPGDKFCPLCLKDKETFELDWIRP